MPTNVQVSSLNTNNATGEKVNLDIGYIQA